MRALRRGSNIQALPRRNARIVLLALLHQLVNDHRRLRLALQYHLKPLFHKFPAGHLRHVWVIQIPHFIASIWFKPMQAKAHGLTRTPHTPERFDHPFAKTRPIILPCHPSLIRRIITRQRIVIAEKDLSDFPPLSKHMTKVVVICVLSSHVPSKIDLGSPCTAKIIIVVGHRWGSEERNPEGDPIAGVLYSNRFIGVVAAMQGYCPAQRLQVVPPAAAGARVEKNIGMQAVQPIQILKETFYVPDFRDPLAIRRIMVTPELQRRDIKIRPIYIDTLLSNEIAHMVDQPFDCGWIS